MLKNLKSLFIIEEEDSKPKKKNKEKATAPNKKEAVMDTSTVKESRSGEPGKVTPKFTEVLLKAMQDNDLQGFDYLEFKKSLSSLSKMPMDEATRYRSAFAMAQTMGATPSHLIETAQHYLNVLKKEEDKFEVALANQQSSKIGSKQQSIKKSEEQINAKAQKIQQLTKEIETLQAKIKKLQQQIGADTHKVETTKNNFIASYMSLVKQIRHDLENMKQYLPK